MDNASSSTELKIRGLNPGSVFFDILFLVLGSWFLSFPFTSKSYDGLGLIIVAPLTILFLYSGITGLLLYMQVSSTTFKAFSSWSTNPKRYQYTPFKIKQVLLADIQSVSFRSIEIRNSKGGGRSPTMVLNLQNGDIRILGIGPYRKKDLQKVATVFLQHDIQLDNAERIFGKGKVPAGLANQQPLT